PVWASALTVGTPAAIVAFVNIFSIATFEKMYFDTHLALPVPTQVYLQYHWHVCGAILLALLAYPILNRLGRRLAIVAVVAGRLFFLTFLTLALFLPLVQLIQGIK